VRPAEFAVYVKPGSRRPGIGRRDGAFEVRVAAPARDGLANRAVCAAVAAALGCPRTAVTLVRGGTARTKVLAVATLDGDEVARRLGAAADRVA